MWAVAFGGSLPLGTMLAGFTAEKLSPYLTITLFAGLLALAGLVIYLKLPPREQGGNITPAGSR